MKFALVSILALCVCLFSSPLVSAWGDQGHQITAYVAQKLLSSQAASQVSSILNGQSLVDVATWADSVKRHPGYLWSESLHFIDTPDWACTYNPNTDCPGSMCVAGAILNYTSRLHSTSIGATQVQEALKFLTHFAGDIHQPLHVAFASDRGGNSIKGHYNGDSANLHAVWDMNIIEESISNRFNGDQNQYASYLVQQLQTTWASNMTAWTSCSASDGDCPNAWATETAQYACNNAYVDNNGNQVQDGFQLGDDNYYPGTSPVVDFQLAKGGVRLASILNKVFSSSRFEDAFPTNTIVVA